MERRKSVLVFLIFILCPFALGAAGVSPGYRDINFEPNLKESVYFNFIGDPDSDFEIYLSGDLSEYAKVSPSTVKGSGRVDVYFDFPEKIDLPGPHIVYVGARQARKENVQGVAIVSNVQGVIHVNVPYPDSYLSLNLEAKNAKAGEPVELKLDLRNLGKAAARAKSTIEIYNSASKRIRMLDLGEDEIAPGDSKSYQEKLETTSYPAGFYKARAASAYSGKTAEAEKEFRLGELYVNITGYTENLERDKINKFDINVESLWNDPLENVFAEVSIPNYNINFPTPSIKLNGFEKGTVTGYFDTTGIEEKSFEAVIKLHYEGKITERKAILRFKKEANYLLYGLIGALLLAVIIFILVLLWHNRLKKRQNAKRKK